MDSCQSFGANYLHVWFVCSFGQIHTATHLTWSESGQHTIKQWIKTFYISIKTITIDKPRLWEGRYDI